MMELSGSLVRLAIRVDPAEAGMLVAEFSEMFTRVLLRPDDDQR